VVSPVLAEAVASALGDVLREDHLFLEQYDARHGAARHPLAQGIHSQRADRWT
jgi:hypothetical protein